MALSPPFQLVACARTLPCDGRLPVDPARARNTQAVLREARGRMRQAGLWRDAPEALLVVLDVPLPPGVVALTVDDPALHGVSAYPGRPAILVSSPVAGQDLDILLHELTHVWLRSLRDGSAQMRWRVEAGRASHESALLHEAVADAVSATLTRDARIGEATMPHGGARSLDIAIACPEGLTGLAYSDASLVSHPLWELSGQGQDAAASAQVLHALAGLATGDMHSIPAFLQAFPEALGTRAPALAKRWHGLADKAQLHRCREPLPLSAISTIAREGDFMSPGMIHFPGRPPPGALLVFEGALPGGGALRVSLRSSVPEPLLSVQWQALGAGRQVLAHGLTPLQGWPSRFIDIVVPEGSRTLRVEVVNPSLQDVGFNNVVLHIPATTVPGVDDVSSPMDLWPWWVAGLLLSLTVVVMLKPWVRSG